MFKRFNRIAKVVITLGSLVYIGFQIDKNSNLAWSGLQISSHYEWWLIAFLMIFPNWLIESIKWSRITQRKLQSSVIMEVLIGHFAGLSTPFKAGDYWYRSNGKSERIAGVVFSNYALVLALLAFGVLLAFERSEAYSWVLLILSVVGSLLYFGIDKFRIPRLAQFHIQTPSLAIRIWLLFWSLLRVLVFSLALTILLSTVVHSMSFWSIFSAVIVVYATTAILPIIQLMDFSVRSGVAIWVFGQAVDPFLITGVYFGHTVLHNYIPACIGGWLWWKRDKNVSTHQINE